MNALAYSLHLKWHYTCCWQYEMPCLNDCLAEMCGWATIAQPSVTSQKTFTGSQNFSLQTLHVCSGRCSVCGWGGAMFLRTERLGSLLPWQQTTWLGVLDCLGQCAVRHGVSILSAALPLSKSCPCLTKFSVPPSRSFALLSIVLQRG